MEAIPFREQNRRRREQNAFENLYSYAKQKKISDPKRTAERVARRFHSGSDRGGGVAGGAGNRGSEPDRTTPHRLDERTKDELYERAQALDIEGRSKMSKDELVDAIRASQ